MVTASSTLWVRIYDIFFAGMAVEDAAVAEAVLQKYLNNK